MLKFTDMWLLTRKLWDSYKVGSGRRWVDGFFYTILYSMSVGDSTRFRHLWLYWFLFFYFMGRTLASLLSTKMLIRKCKIMWQKLIFGWKAEKYRLFESDNEWILESLELHQVYLCPSNILSAYFFLQACYIYAWTTRIGVRI